MPGQPEKSLLIKAVRHVNGMPKCKGSKLSDREIADLTRWVQMGLPYPESPAPAKGRSEKLVGVSDSAPARIPAVKNTAWAKSPLDRFILAKLETRDCSPRRRPIAAR